MDQGVTTEEMALLRFDCNMNLLQLVCHERAISILKYITKVTDPLQREQMASYRDEHLGS